MWKHMGYEFPSKGWFEFYTHYGDDWATLIKGFEEFMGGLLSKKGVSVDLDGDDDMSVGCGLSDSAIAKSVVDRVLDYCKWHNEIFDVFVYDEQSGVYSCGMLSGDGLEMFDFKTKSYEKTISFFDSDKIQTIFDKKADELFVDD